MEDAASNVYISLLCQIEQEKSRKEAAVHKTSKAMPISSRPSIVKPEAEVRLTSRPKSAGAIPAAAIQKRQWSALPEELLPTPTLRPGSSTIVDNRRTSATTTTRTTRKHALLADKSPILGDFENTNEATQGKSTQPSLSTKKYPVSPNRTRRVTERRRSNIEFGITEQTTLKHDTFLTEAPSNAIARGSIKKPSQVIWTRFQRATDEETEATDSGLHQPSTAATRRSSEQRRQSLTLVSDLKAAEAKREEVKSVHALNSMRKKDVDVDDVHPLVEIAYWSPFIEVRRDAAAALNSLTRNVANLGVLAEAGALGALLSMLNSHDRVDPSVARDCAQALASMAKLQSVQLKILHAPEGLDSIFALLHSSDNKLRRTAFEIVQNLITIDELRQVVAKREGFAFMLDSCSSKDARIRLRAAAILHQLVECRDNRFLFCHSTTHFATLADILHNPFMEKDLGFRRELLSFIQLLVSEEENARKFVDQQLVPTLLSILDAPKTNLQVCLLVVSIIESVAMDKKNHPALVTANALPRIVQLCFSPNRGRPLEAGKVLASGMAIRLGSSSGGGERLHTHPQKIISSCVLSRQLNRTLNLESKGLQNPACSLSSEVNVILRPAFVVFCEMAKNVVNREHIVRSKLLDYIANKNLYASPDKRVRRSVISLLTLLICKENERERERRTTFPAIAVTTDSNSNSESDPGREFVTSRGYQPPQLSSMDAEAEYKHYIELLARGVVKCLFGILKGNDFSMKVDAIAAIAQLTKDKSSRLTMCKPTLLQSLKEFAFHPLVATRYNIAMIIANFAERPENILKLVDEGMLDILVKYVCPVARNNDVLYEATRAIAAMSNVHVTRNKLVECGVLGTLLQFCKSSSITPEIHDYALIAIRNLRHDAAALRIQAIYRGWYVRLNHTRNIMTRKRKGYKMMSIQKVNLDSSIVTAMERF